MSWPGYSLAGLTATGHDYKLAQVRAAQNCNGAEEPTDGHRS